MKRPMLVSGITSVICGALFLIFGIKGAVAVCVPAASVLIVYIIKKYGINGKIIIPTVCVFSIAASLCFLFFHFTVIRTAEKLESDSTDVYAAVTQTPETQNGVTTYTLRLVNTDYFSRRIKITYSEKSDEPFKLYDCIAINTASLKIPHNSDLSVNTYYFSDGVFLKASSAEKARFVYECKRTPFYYCLKLKENCTDIINSYLNPQKEGGLLCGMVFGDKSNVSDEIINSFRLSGISHLLAVSGLHTSLWCGLIISILSLFGASDRIKAFFCMAFLAAFCIITGFTPSVMRAALMTFLSLCAPLFYKKADSLNSLGAAVFVLVLINPYILTSPGFVLSVSSTLGVISVSAFENIISKISLKIKNRLLKKLSRYVLSSLLVSIAAGVFTLPACAYFFNTFSLIAPLTNLLTVKPAFYAMASGICAVALGAVPFRIFQGAALLLFKPVRAVLGYIIFAAGSLSNFKYAVIPTDKNTLAVGFAVIAVLACIIYGLKSRRKSVKLQRVLYTAAAGVLVISLIFGLLPISANTYLTVFSVGDGVCAAVRCGTHFALINCGNVSGSENLPLTKMQTLDIFAALSVPDNMPISYYDILNTYSPETVILSRKARSSLINGDVIFENNPSVTDGGTVYLAEKTAVKFVDTNGVNCVIIKSNKVTALLALDENTVLDEAVSLAGTVPDIVVCSARSLSDSSLTFDNAVISCDSARLTEGATLSASQKCAKMYITALDGDITLRLA